MKVIIDMEIETPDYGGKEFKREIEKLLENIIKETDDMPGSIRLTRFKMREKYGFWNVEKDIDWMDKTH